MNKVRWRITALFLVLLFIGCAAQKPNRLLVYNVFTSDYPPLQITFLNLSYTSHEKVDSGGLKGWIYDYGQDRGINIIIEDIGGLHSGGKSYDYYNSIEQIASSNEMINLDSVLIKDHKWLKYAEMLRDETYLCTGYFTRKDRYLISVYGWASTDIVDLREMKEYKKTRRLSDSLRQMLTEELDKADTFFTIDF